MRPLRIEHLRPALIVVVLWVCACSSSAPVGPYVSWHHHAAPDLQDAVLDDGPFTMALERHFADDGQDALLRRVEETYPLYESSRLLAPLSRPAVGGEPRWWLEERQGIQIPATLWAGAVHHLVELILGLRRGEELGFGGVRPTQARLHYQASIEPADAALEPEWVSPKESLFVVHIALTWESRCGPRCGLSFSRSRTALVQGDGRVIESYEDPLPSVIVY